LGIFNIDNIGDQITKTTTKSDRRFWDQAQPRLRFSLSKSDESCDRKLVVRVSLQRKMKKKEALK